VVWWVKTAFWGGRNGDVYKNSRLKKGSVDVGEVKVNPPKADEKRWLFVSHRAINWPNFVLPTFDNTSKAERNAGIRSKS
jgi:hypothetical protein